MLVNKPKKRQKDSIEEKQNSDFKLWDLKNLKNSKKNSFLTNLQMFGKLLLWNHQKEENPCGCINPNNMEFLIVWESLIKLNKREKVMLYTKLFKIDYIMIPNLELVSILDKKELLPLFLDILIPLTIMLLKLLDRKIKDSLD